MKRALLLVAAVFLATPAIAKADKLDDYTACLIGQAAVALNGQAGTKDTDAAQDFAYRHCTKPHGIDDESLTGLEDFVNISVEKIAGIWPASE